METAKHRPSPVVYTIDGLSADEKSLRFLATGANVAVMNALRRCIIAHVPSAAFPYDPTLTVLPDAGIVVRKNTSVLHNEMLGARVALVPVCADEHLMPRLAADPGMLRFRLHVKNRTPNVLLVTSRDIQVTARDTDAPVSDSERDALFPACPTTGDHILIVKLRPNPYDIAEGEEVSLEAVVAVKAESEGDGDGRKHARWSPVSVCYFTNTVDEARAGAAFREAEERARAAGEDMSPDAVRAREAQFRTLDRLRHFRPDSFEFALESECGLRAPFLVRMGFAVLLRRVLAIRDAVQKRDASKVRYARFDGQGGQGGQGATSSLSLSDVPSASNEMYNLVIADEDHTCGNLLQALMFERNFEADGRPKPGSDVRYVGYHQPHPSEREIVLRVRLSEPSASVEGVILDNLEWITDVLRAHSAAWARAAGMHTPRGRTKYALDQWDL